MSGCCPSAMRSFSAGRPMSPRMPPRSGACRRSWRFSSAPRPPPCSAGSSAALAIRRQGIYFAMITLALAQMMYFFALQAPFTGGEDGIQAVPRGTLFGFVRPRDELNHVLSSCWSWSWSAFCLIYRTIHSPFGQVLKAIRENEPRAISLGYKTDRYKLLAFVLSATLAGLAGAQSAGVPARLADRRPLADVGRGRADDAARRPGHGLRPGGRRLHHRHAWRTISRRSAAG